MKKEHKKSRYYNNDDFDEYQRKRKSFKFKNKKFNFKSLIHSGDEVDYEYLEEIEDLAHEETNK